KNVVSANPAHGGRKVLMGLNTGFKKYGQSGLAVADWWQHVGQCADDIAVVRSLWTSDNDHGAQLQFHTGRHVREGAYPTVGSWACYGLGTLNQNLPEYVVLGTPTGDCCGGEWTHGAAYLGPEYAGGRVRQAVPRGPSARGARRALRANLPRRRRRRGVGRPRQHQGQPHATGRPGGPTHRRLTQGPETARPAEGHARGLGHRVRPFA